MTAKRSYFIVVGLLAALVLILFFLSLMIGPAAIGFKASLCALFWSDDAGTIAQIMREIRLPRAILGAMIGASLGLSGAVLQGYLRNPLNEPGLLGVGGAASLGAVIAIYTGLTAVFALALPLFAFIGALLAVAFLRVLAGSAGGSMNVILAGVAITSFTGAMTALALNLSSNPFAALEIMFWMLGSLTDRSMIHVWLSAPFIIAGWLMMASLGRALDALTLGEGTAASLGVRLGRVQALAIIGTACSVGAATAVAGSIGFVGLVVPHLLRPLVGAQPSRLLLTSALGGAALLLAADIAVRLVAPDKDLKLGVLTALIGAPFFVWLIYQKRQRWL